MIAPKNICYNRKIAHNVVDLRILPGQLRFEMWNPAISIAFWIPFFKGMTAR
jgi:hypothetical protein